MLYTLVGIQVVVTNRHFIQAVSHAFPGTYPDAMLIKFFKPVTSLQPTENMGNWLKERTWYVQGRDAKMEFCGCYFICDGGYLRWQSLLGPWEIPSNKRLEKYQGMLAAVCKDVKCTFGGLKKRFRSLKGWSDLNLLERWNA